MVFTFILVTWVFSVCVHEFAHAAVAYLGGDTTVKYKGYLTLNPLKYTDPLLSIGLPIAILLIGGLGLPGGCVYIERHLLRSRAWDCAVSLAGPLANFVLAIVLAAPFYLGFVDPYSTETFWQAYAFLVVLQVCAGVFNLIPIPGFDGFQALLAWFDYELQARMRALSGYGLLIVFIVFWNIEPINTGFWIFVFRIGSFLGVPPDMAIAGLEEFMIL